MENQNQNYCKDYIEKIKNKLIYDSSITNKDEVAKDFNSLINFMNYCFLNKNNFFVENFNKRVIKTVCLTYNKIKTNILTNNVFDLFDKIELDGMKSIRFIIINAINNYQTIKENNNEICSIITKDSLKRCLVLINTCIKRKQ